MAADPRLWFNQNVNPSHAVFFPLKHNFMKLQKLYNFKIYIWFYWYTLLYFLKYDRTSEVKFNWFKMHIIELENTAMVNKLSRFVIIWYNQDINDSYFSHDLFPWHLYPWLSFIDASLIESYRLFLSLVSQNLSLIFYMLWNCHIFFLLP